MYGAAHNSGAPGLSAPAVRTERLLSGLQMSPQPRRAICRFLQVGVGQGQGLGGAKGLVSFPVPEGGSRVWSGRFGPVVETEKGVLSIIWCPASCCWRDYCLLARP